MTQQPVLAPLIARFATLWSMPSLMQTSSVAFSSRLHRTWGRTNLQRRSITLAADLESDPALLETVLCHELAHVAAYELVGPSERAHGPTWQRLVSEAGQQPVARLRETQPARSPVRPAARSRFLHRCPVCDFSRRAGKPMTSWCCADCVAAGLDGALVITKERTGEE